MKINPEQLKKLGIDTTKRHFSFGPTTPGYLGLLLTWAIILGHISAWWLLLAIPCMISSLGSETQEIAARIKL